MKVNSWTIKGGRVLNLTPFLIAGIVNATPDSFYDGGVNYDSDVAIKHGKKLIEQGADILDIGGESTRPFSKSVPAQVELKRVLPVVSALSKDYIVSVDTVKSSVAKECLEAGAQIINDVSCFSMDPDLLEVVAEYKPGYVLMHSKGTPENMQVNPNYGDLLTEMLAFFDNALNTLVSKGVPENRVVIDPGIGFGKTVEHNLYILKHIEKFYTFNLPVYMGLSNKSVWGGLLGLDVNERQNATQVATALLANKGVAIHRVHDVKLTHQSLKIVEAIGGKNQ